MPVKRRMGSRAGRVSKTEYSPYAFTHNFRHYSDAAQFARVASIGGRVVRLKGGGFGVL